MWKGIHATQQISTSSGFTLHFGVKPGLSKNLSPVSKLEAKLLSLECFSRIQVACFLTQIRGEKLKVKKTHFK